MRTLNTIEQELKAAREKRQSLNEALALRRSDSAAYEATAAQRVADGESVDAVEQHAAHSERALRVLSKAIGVQEERITALAAEMHPLLEQQAAEHANAARTGFVAATHELARAVWAASESVQPAYERWNRMRDAAGAAVQRQTRISGGSPAEVSGVRIFDGPNQPPLSRDEDEDLFTVLRPLLRYRAPTASRTRAS